MLGWFCDPFTTVQRVLKGHQAELSGDTLPDEVVDSDISILRSYFSDDVWKIVLGMGIIADSIITCSTVIIPIL